MDFPALLGQGISAFAATNIDDIFLLMVFFSTHTFSSRQVVVGQYLGIGALTAVGVVGSAVALVVPTYIIGLMGFVPIAIGVKKLVELRKHEETDQVPEAVRSGGKRLSYIPTVAISAVTFSNGGDNIGVYIPLFANNSAFAEIITLVTIFMILTATWCAIGYYLVHHRLLAGRVRRLGHIVLPFVLMALGTYILAEAFIMPS